jgi:hypothetical protein
MAAKDMITAARVACTAAGRAGMVASSPSRMAMRGAVRAAEGVAAATILSTNPAIVGAAMAIPAVAAVDPWKWVDSEVLEVAEALVETLVGMGGSAPAAADATVASSVVTRVWAENSEVMAAQAFVANLLVAAAARDSGARSLTTAARL